MTEVHYCLGLDLREGFTKKVAVLLDFVQMRGGGQIFCPLLQTVYIGSIWGWGGKGEPLPKLFGTLALKKSGTSYPNLGEGGGRGNLDKIQKNSYFFS